MGDNVRDFIEAQSRYDSAGQKVSTIVAVIQEVAEYLSGDPMNFLFSNIPQGIPSPLGATRTAKSVDGQNWPTAGDIQRALAALHEAKHSLGGAWDRLSPRERQAMQPPPERFVPTRRA